MELRDVIEVDPFPLAVNVDTPLVQVHKMFAMLCANKMYVMDRRRLVGCLPLQRVSWEWERGGGGTIGCGLLNHLSSRFALKPQ